MQLQNDIKLDFDDVLITPKRSTLSSRKEVSLIRDFKFRNSGAEYSGIPIMAANMDGVGTFEIAELFADLRLFTCLTKHYSVDELAQWINHKGGFLHDYWAYSLGIGDKDLEKFNAVSQRVPAGSIKYVNIDVANGYTETFVNFVAKFRDANPDTIIIAGNVVTREITEQLLLRGADIVKVGIGGGAQCSTRLKTGIGCLNYLLLLNVLMQHMV